jgi:hypothetical protein
MSDPHSKATLRDCEDNKKTFDDDPERWRKDNMADYPYPVGRWFIIEISASSLPSMPLHEQEICKRVGGDSRL